MYMTPIGFAVTVVASFLAGIFACVAGAFYLGKKLNLWDDDDLGT